MSSDRSEPKPCSDRGAGAERARSTRALAGKGFTLVALMVVLIVLNIAVATAMQIWSKVDQREKEEELIFRGLQYAEAIRVFQRRFDRPPTSLEELMEVRPRVIRQLWTDPLSKSGEWVPILAGSGTDVTALAQGNRPGEGRGARPGQVQGQGQGQGRQGARRGGGRQQPGQSPQAGRLPGSQSGFGESSRSGSFGSRRSGSTGTGEQLSRAFDEAAGVAGGPGGSSFGSDAEQTQIGPIEGVKPTASGEAMKHFLGRTEYSAWEFRAEMLAEPRVSPEGVPLTPRLDPSALGRPFPDWVTGVLGEEPHPGLEGDTPPELLPEDSDDDS